MFAEAQTLLKRNGRSGGRATRTKHAALLRGMLRCATCNCAMSHSFTSRGHRQYRYYVCQRAQTHGWQACPSPSIPAGEIERFVVNEIKCVGRDPQVIKETFVQARRQAEEQIDRLKSERAGLVRQLRDSHGAIGRLAADVQSRRSTTDRRTGSRPRRGATRDADRRRAGEIGGRPGRRMRGGGGIGGLRRRVGRAWPRVNKPASSSCSWTRSPTTARRAALRSRSGPAASERWLLNCRRVRRKRHDHGRTESAIRAGAGEGGRRLARSRAALRTPTGRVPRVARLMALAIRFDQLIRDGVVADQAELARIGHVSRARLTQIMNLLNLAPDIQEEILFLPPTDRGRDAVTERELRPITANTGWSKQRRMWQAR